MAEITTVCIGIQARSTSRRFPRKVFETIDGKPVLKHVIDACQRAANYMNRHTHNTQTLINVALCVPTGDEIIDHFRKSLPIVEGPEDDVLERYRLLAEKQKCDYMVRVTGDCPLIPPYLITKHIKAALVNGYDYLSNIDEEARTAADGLDCEVISRKLLDWMAENAKEQYDREHVTPMARKSPPAWARIGHIVGFMDLSHLKLSVDTPEDLERVRAAYDRVKLALARAEAKSGKSNTHRF